jgi:hypothetical protein
MYTYAAEILTASSSDTPAAPRVNVPLLRAARALVLRDSESFGEGRPPCWNTSGRSSGGKGAICCDRQTSIAKILPRMNDHPTLVTEEIQGEERLLGIITAFDLL